MKFKFYLIDLFVFCYDKCFINICIFVDIFCKYIYFVIFELLVKMEWSKRKRDLREDNLRVEELGVEYRIVDLGADRSWSRGADLIGAGLVEGSCR